MKKIRNDKMKKMLAGFVACLLVFIMILGALAPLFSSMN